VHALSRHDPHLDQHVLYAYNSSIVCSRCLSQASLLIMSAAALVRAGLLGDSRQAYDWGEDEKSSDASMTRKMRTFFVCLRWPTRGIA
jgi:hypothetical protein